MSDELFNVKVPNEDLKPRGFEMMPAGEYRTTLQSGAEVVGNSNGWAAVRLPFSGFTDKTGKTFQRDRAVQYTTENAGSPQAVEIGQRALIAAATAFGLTEDTTGDDGKPAQKLTASSMDELVAQFNSVAGTEVEVYLTVKKRKKGGQVVLKDDGTPVLDNEIARVSAIKETP